jgi:methyl-accepting chemotaxis protein
MKWLNGQRIGTKLALLGAVGILSVGLPAYFVVADALSRIEAAKFEQHAVEPATAVLRVLQLTQQHRALSAAVAAGNASLAQARAAKETEVTDALYKMGLTLANTIDDAVIGEAIDKALHSWKTTSDAAKAKSTSAQETITQHTALIAEFLVLLDRVADHFKLSMDPQRDGFQLVNATVVHLPQVIETLGALQAKGTMILTQKMATGQDNAEFLQLLSLAELHQSNMKRAMDKVNELSPALKEALQDAAKASGDEARSILRLADKQIAQTDNLNYDASKYFDGFSKTVETQLKLTDTAMAKLSDMLDERIAAETARAGLIAGVVALVVALAVLIGWVISRSITVPLREAVAVAQKVAAGDLTSVMEVTSRDETGMLLAALKDMNESLRQIVTNVRSSTDELGSASQQIVSGNSDLSRRTEAQAASLEETASSMEEVASTVQQNTESAVRANELAASASAVASKGGAVVGQVVKTMSSINEASTRVVDIIGVIDGIAFQTNILALNAAVEAARAGDQGRGFAVVASEVRSLAQRSSAAAKEIKALISDSASKVKDGTKLVTEAGKTMEEIVVSVSKVTEIISEIAAASREQSSGIEQVNQAIVQMDQVTQQNAALVEEVAAAAESMDQQAQGLAQAVAIFKLASEPDARPHQSGPAEADGRREPAAAKVATDVLTHGLDRDALRA